jgi:hypothetical protein
VHVHDERLIPTLHEPIVGHDEREIVVESATTIQKMRSGKKIADLDAQRAGELEEQQHAEVPHAPFDARFVGAINAHDVGEMFLAPAALFAHCADPITDFLEMRIPRALPCTRRHAWMLERCGLFEHGRLCYNDFS